jgi:rod shape-determining protein MreC
MANGTLRLTRGRNGNQLSLAILAVIALTIVFLGRVQPTLFDRGRAYVSDRTAPILETLRMPVRTTVQWTGSLAQLFTVYQENLRLKEQNARLRQWQNAALMLEQRLKRYQLLLNAVPNPETGNVTAHVIGRSTRPFLSTMILDAGQRDRVKPGEAVVDERGMIGRIFLAGNHTSWVILLTDLNSRIPVSIQPGNIQAIMAGDNSSAPTLEISAQGAAVTDGEQIETSGDGALLPPGLLVGKIFRDGAGFRAALFADAGRSSDVRVLELKAVPEQPPVPTKNDLPVTAAGLPPLTPPAPKVTAANPPVPAPGTALAGKPTTEPKRVHTLHAQILVPPVDSSTADGEAQGTNNMQAVPPTTAPAAPPTTAPPTTSPQAQPNPDDPNADNQ